MKKIDETGRRAEELAKMDSLPGGRLFFESVQASGARKPEKLTNSDKVQAGMFLKTK